MNPSVDETPVFNYVAAIQGKEFIVTISQNRMSRWDDLSSCTLDDRLRDDEPEGSVPSVRISDEIYRMALEMVEREKLEEARTGQFQSPAGETAKDIAEMDRLFDEFFWRVVNPQLPQPLVREDS